MKHAATLLSAVLGVLWCSAVSAGNPCVTAAGEAQDLRAANHLREARTSLLACSAPSCNPVVRASCEKWLSELDAQQPTVVVHAVDARGHDVLGVSMTIDDSAINADGGAIAVDPGWHLARATTPSGEVANQRFMVALGEKARVLELRFDAPKAAEPKRPEQQSKEPPATSEASDQTGKRNVMLPIVLSGVGIIALGAFAYFEVVGHQGYSELENGCFRTKTCTPALEDPVKAQFLAAYVSVGIAAAAIGAAALIFFTSGSSSAATKAISRRGIAF
jgi:hypothetical protein